MEVTSYQESFEIADFSEAICLPSPFSLSVPETNKTNLSFAGSWKHTSLCARGDSLTDRAKTA